MQHEISIDRELQFMIKYQLTPEEYLLLELLFLAQNEHEEYLTAFYSQGQYDHKILDLLQALKEKEIINKSYVIPEEGTIFNPQDVELNKRVLNQYIQHSQDLGMDLFQNYPPFTTINGKTFSLRNIAKNFKSFDDFCFEYGKTIKFDIDKHREIMDLLEYGKENNLIHSGICDFVISRQWETLDALKDGNLGTFNTNELI